MRRFFHFFAGANVNAQEINTQAQCFTIFTDINECASDPCMNGATCNDEVNKYRCTCVTGYAGYNCNAGVFEHSDYYFPFS